MSTADLSPVAVARLRAAGYSFGLTAALRDIDLTVHPGERIAVLGASGAGKSTLLKLLNLSLSPTQGSVEVLGADATTLSAAALRDTRRRIGAVSQDLALIDQVRVLHNVNAGRLGRWGTMRALASLIWARPDAEVLQALDQVGLGWAVHERTERLSGGERQRVAVARLLVQKPELVLADEPVSSLDPTRAAAVLSLLGTTVEGGSLVVSLHQPELARAHCTRVLGLREGRLVLDLPAAELSDAALDELYARA